MGRGSPKMEPEPAAAAPRGLPARPGGEGVGGSGGTARAGSPGLRVWLWECLPSILGLSQPPVFVV